MFKLPGDMGKLFEQVKNMKANAEQAQNALREKTAQASSGGGMVTATVNGLGELLTIHIEPSVVDPTDTEMLEDLIVSAVSAAVARSRQMAQDTMAGSMGVDNLDALKGMFGK